MTTKCSNEFTVLDYVEGIKVPGDVFAKPANEYWALVFLRDGMKFLHRQAVRCDEVVRGQINPDGKLKIISCGNLPELSSVPQGLLTCAFHWYAIAACQYVRTVGAIALRQDSTRSRPDEYANSVIPEVVAFRDKVAAHFAWTTKNKQDNEAERLASIIPPLTFINDSFYVGAQTVTIRSGGRKSNSTDIKPWSISGIHKRMSDRYWPGMVVGHNAGANTCLDGVE